MTDFEILSLVIAILTLVVGVIALVIKLIVFFDTRYLRNGNKKPTH